MLSISGVEADYDGEKISFDEAVEILEKAGIEAIVYTSPSHMREGHGPRWRILCRLSKEYPPEHREHFLNRLAGLFRDGNVTVLAPESWTPSQAYYFGAVDYNPEHRVKLIEGEELDELDDLDLIALGKPAGDKAGDNTETGPHRPGPPQASIGDIQAALAAIPNDWTSWERWNTLGMAIFAASGGSGRGYGLFSRWSRRNDDAYDKTAVKERWRHWQRSSPPSKIGFGTLVHLARQADPNFVLPSASQSGADDFSDWERHHPFPDPGDIDPGPTAGPPAEDDHDTSTSWATPAPASPEKWPAMEAEAFHGLAGQVVDAIAPTTEADPVAILAHFLVEAGNAIGRNSYCIADGARHYPNLYAVIVGDSSKGRKGTAARRVE
jgi:hypothetical protein